MELKLPFGIRDGKLVGVAQVERGIACGCFCPACKHPLVAKKGSKIAHHFAHNKSSECANALETALHLAAKEILERRKKIRLPAVEGRIGQQWLLLYPEQTVKFERVYLEQRQKDVIPDIVIELNGRTLFVEIAVTHFIGKEKIEKIKAMKISTIEIDLSGLDRQVDFDVLESILVEGLHKKRWIYNAKEIAFREKIEVSFGIEYPVTSRGMASHVDDCPLRKRIWNGKPYANLVDDCFHCEYLDDFRGDDWSSHTHITCIGKANKEIAAIVESHKKRESFSLP